MNEWGFIGEVKSWIDEIAKLNTNLPFAGARVEEVGSGSQKRRDLTLIGRDGDPLLTGEVKLPDAPDGGSPYRAEVVKDAQQKALRAGVKFLFTWNVNECVLWEAATAGPALRIERTSAGPWQRSLTVGNWTRHPCRRPFMSGWSSFFMTRLAYSRPAKLAARVRPTSSLSRHSNRR